MRLIDSLGVHARFRPHVIAAADADERLTWLELWNRVARTAAGLRAQGLRPGDRAGILALNGVRYFEAQLALWWAGAVVVPMNIRWTVEESVFAAQDCEMSVLLADAAYDAHARQVVNRVISVRRIALDVGDADALSLDDLARDAPLAVMHQTSPDALAGIYYTGGTTGAPKGVMLSHRALWTAGIVFALAAQMSGGSQILHAAPMFHLADGAMGHAALIAGATNVYVPRFEAEGVLQAIEAQAVSEVILVPTMIGMLVESPNYKPARLRSLRSLFFGASPIASTLLAAVRADHPDLRLVHCYGQTEMGPTISFLEPHLQIPGSPKSLSVGMPFASVDVRIEGEDGEEAAPNQPGELLARGPTMMSGYWNRPEETARTLVDGWVHTGDLAFRDEDGFLFICDRVKDMVITGGENVFSAEVENAICAHPAVEEAAVIGVPDENYGERVHAVLVLRKGQSIDQAQLFEHCRRLIANYKCPRSIETRTELPISAAGKVLKRELRAPHWAGRERAVN